MTLEHLGFERIGSYYRSNDCSVQRKASVKISERLHLVYCITENQVPAYIGKSIQGYKRPLGYHRNNVMKKVRDGIVHSLIEGHEIDVYAKTKGLVLDHEGLTLNVIDAIENALIQNWQPKWNKFNNISTK